MIEWLKWYSLSVPVFFGLNLLWLGVFAHRFYLSHMSALINPNIRWSAALLFMFIFLAGLMTFVIQPAIQKQSIRHAALYGALFGLVAYASFNLFNLAALKTWSPLISAVDMLWGALLSAAVSALTVYCARLIRND